AKSVNPDGSIVMSTNVPQGSRIRITFGDPRQILTHTSQTIMMIHDFAPQVVGIVNCMGRKLFWSENKDVEVSLLSKYMQSTGFSALGEILRYKGITVLNNLSVITIAMREGPAGKTDNFDLEELENSTNLPITARLAIFINTITDELMEKNTQLNDMLYEASHDYMTGLLNRGAIERMIYDAEPSNLSNWYLIMFDVDNFKMINDNYGHAHGDAILKCISEILSDYMADIPNVEVGRWGGEEFMIMVSDCDNTKAKNIAHGILETIKEESKRVTPVTISVGVTNHRKNEYILDTINRVDELMYESKSRGKNRVSSDLM
ncbi:MAG: diguanylate cyclase, partial [Lachnospiraceae bacterium]|nr:diguanylate cyclase [Lachnospiraceae bacterium]